ncbi:SAM-dependent methyltransferase [Rubellicoccus peritrichatus]|uniref:SAM-dependent methyltransferase n=1 Tax=Rubellicoccus peritrichatus TaxID=3080537 RepID=A0AAQ3L6G6_9BACT|nr:SAM-dependent methyltransferase [Puniceicoccus sp. CR14]WOO39956.1 SAM-dependent methyltransferase [Puniceicoccus sp. CR14]
MREDGIINALKTEAQKHTALTYAQFCEIALYHPLFGYYQQKRQRVGRNRDTDFYTAESLGPVFAQLTIAAVKSILRHENLNDFTFVELGAEPGSGSFAETTHNFNGYQAFSVQDEILLSGKSVVFANEILDAQPFHRLVFKNGVWRELGVRLDGDELVESELPELSQPIVAAELDLPSTAPDGYLLDVSPQAEALLHKICSNHWQGVLVLFDYGKLWHELVSNCPSGTARAYRRHNISRNLLDTPGQQDLTCHVCWDRLEKVALRSGFTAMKLERQEAFFVHHAQDEISRIISSKPGEFDSARQDVIELIHPHHMGSKFQVLSGLRMP